MICVSYASSTSSATSMHLKKAQERKNVKKIFAIEGGKKILILCVLFFLQSNFIQVSSQTFTVCPSEVPTARSTYDWCEEGKYKCVSSSNSGHYGCSFCTGGKYITEALSESSLQRGMGYFQHKSTSCLLCQDGKISASDFKACVDCDSGKVADATGENCITPCKINEYLNASECKACPILRYSQLGATAEADCKCAAGSYLNQNNVWYGHHAFFIFFCIMLIFNSKKVQKTDTDFIRFFSFSPPPFSPLPPLPPLRLPPYTHTVGRADLQPSVHELHGPWDHKAHFEAGRGD